MLGRIYSTLLERAHQGGELSLPLLAGQFAPEEMDHLTEIISKPEIVQGSRQKALHDYIDVIKTEHSKAAPDDDLRAMAEKYRQKKGYGV